jgi:hypothetical protein
VNITVFTHCKQIELHTHISLVQFSPESKDNKIINNNYVGGIEIRFTFTAFTPHFAHHSKNKLQSISSLSIPSIFITFYTTFIHTLSLRL